MSEHYLAATATQPSSVQAALGSVEGADRDGGAVQCQWEGNEEDEGEREARRQTREDIWASGEVLSQVGLLSHKQ